MDIDIEKVLQAMRDAAKPHAQAKSERVHLEQFRKSKKALLMVEAEKKGLKTVSERECYAYAHDDYIQLLDALGVAVYREELNKTIIEGCRLSAELYRTQCANNRSEKNGYGA